MAQTPIAQNALETFLSGMETHLPTSPVSEYPALKPSLVEWKPMSTSPTRSAMPTLKPSLVEWKQDPLYQREDQLEEP